MRKKQKIYLENKMAINKSISLKELKIKLKIDLRIRIDLTKIKLLLRIRNIKLDNCLQMLGKGQKRLDKEQKYKFSDLLPNTNLF